MYSGILSPWHIIIFVAVVLLVFGPKRLPEMGRSLGRGLREFKEGISHSHDEAPIDTARAAIPPAPATRPKDDLIH